MLQAAGKEHEAAVLKVKGLAIASKAYGAFENVEDLVFGCMGVVGGFLARPCVHFDDGDAASGAALAGLDDEVRAEGVGLAFAGLERVRTY